MTSEPRPAGFTRRLLHGGGNPGLPPAAGPKRFGEADWMEPDPAVVDAMTTLLGLIEKSSFAAMAAFHRLHRAVADAAPAPAGEQRTDKGTPPGEGMSAEDAAIVRRIRTRCPDRRFDGGSDEELIQLFKRVLNRSDEDVIAAMVHPRQAAGLASTLRTQTRSRP